MYNNIGVYMRPRQLPNKKYVCLTFNPISYYLRLAVL